MINNKKESVIIKHLHVMLVKRVGLDGKIERNRLFEIIAERIGKIQECEREAVVKELQEHGLIQSHDKFGFYINTDLRF